MGRSKILFLLPLVLFGALACAKKATENAGHPTHAQPSLAERHETSSAKGSEAWHNAEDLSAREKYFIESFNACAQDIANFAPIEEELSHYFFVFKNVKELGDARYLLFAESHTHAASQLWNAGAINALIDTNDVVLFEGEEAGIPIERVEPTFIMDLFATRQYELNDSQENYNVDSIDAIKDAYMSIYYKTVNFLTLNKLKLHRVSGSYWDLIENQAIHPDMSKRNASMVRAMSAVNAERRVFVIAGALHIPHYAFAHAMKYITKNTFGRYHFLNSSADASISVLNDAFYRYLPNLPDMGVASTRVIFEFLRRQKFAVLIPKNLPSNAVLEKFYPKETR